MQANRIEDAIARRKKSKNATSEERLRDTFNESAETLIKKFMQEVMSGHREIENTADLARLFSIYMQVNGLADGNGSGEGMLPQISPSKLNIMEDTIPTSKTVVDGEEETVIDLSDLDNISAEDMASMLMKTEEDMNKQNEATF